MAKVSGAAQRASRLHEAPFQTIFAIRGRPEWHSGQRTVDLKITLDSTDEGRPALTVSLPSED
jgi:hypothetical protein